jgi:hypothetical protein
VSFDLEFDEVKIDYLLWDIFSSDFARLSAIIQQQITGKHPLECDLQEL